MSSPRRPLPEPEQDDSAWLYTYGDIVTLLLTFFVILFAVSGADSRLYDDILKSLGGSVGAGDGLPTAEPPLIPDIRRVVELRGLASSVTVEAGRSEIRIFGADSVFFEPGKAGLHPAAAIFLKEIAGVLRQNNMPLRIEGHTDDQPAEGGPFPSNWELSTARALAVLHFLEAEGIDPHRLCAAGYAQYAPRYPPSPENRSRNRRVELVIQTRQ